MDDVKAAWEARYDNILRLEPSVTPRLSTYRRAFVLGAETGGAVDVTDQARYSDWWAMKVAGWNGYWKRPSTRHALEGLLVIGKALMSDDSAQAAFEDELEKHQADKTVPKLPTLNDETGKPHHRRQRDKQTVAIRHYAVMVRNKFGAMPDTPVNRRVAWEAAYKMMKLDSWRDRDTSKVLPFVVQMAFVPTKEEEQASFALEGAVGAEISARQRRVPVLRV